MATAKLRTSAPAVQKRCTKCSLVLPLAEFSPDRRHRLGVSSACKKCNRERMRASVARYRDATRRRNRSYWKRHRAEIAAAARAWRERNRQRVRAAKAANYAADREAILGYQAAYRAKNAGRIRDRDRQYAAANMTEIMARNRDWRTRNPEKVKAQAKRRRARLSGAGEATLTAEQWAAIVESYDGRCAYCGGRPKSLTQDHVVPLSRGGQHTAANVVPACRSCNCRKWINPGRPMLRPGKAVAHA